MSVLQQRVSLKSSQREVCRPSAGPDKHPTGRGLGSYQRVQVRICSCGRPRHGGGPRAGREEGDDVSPEGGEEQMCPTNDDEAHNEMIC